jgi:ABC-type multidrug transport system permease subunit
MAVDVFRCRVLRGVAGLPFFRWLSLHVLLYLGVFAAASLLWDLGSGYSFSDALIGLIVGFGWSLPLVAVVSFAATVCLGALRLLTDARWYWFRLAALLLFAVPFPLLVLAEGGSQAALSVAVVQLATALLIVQPRRWPHGWAGRDPVMDEHRW